MALFVNHFLKPGTAEVATGSFMLADPEFVTLDKQKEAARRFGETVKAQFDMDPFLAYPKYPPRGKIRLGFLGSDFYDQATGFLSVGLIESIDRSRFQVIAYDYQPFAEYRDKSPFTKRVRSAYDKIYNVKFLTDQQLADQIHSDGIDVLFCLKDPPRGRLGIFARRPAPIQVNYLYYPATMPFMDYIIADDIIIPKEKEWGYLEKVLRMPNCYQPNDNQRYIPSLPKRNEPDFLSGKIVMANFGATFKYTKDICRQWCYLLQQDRSRILLLMVDDVDEQAQFLAFAVDNGTNPSQILFVKELPHDQHMDRLRRVDLVLDTYPYNGHTLTSDALWAGIPVVTLSGETFAARVAESLLLSVGLKELSTHSLTGYFYRANDILNNSAFIGMYKETLEARRFANTLFDTQRYTRDFENLIQGIVEDKWGVQNG